LTRKNHLKSMSRKNPPERKERGASRRIGEKGTLGTAKKLNWRKGMGCPHVLGRGRKEGRRRGQRKRQQNPRHLGRKVPKLGDPGERKKNRRPSSLEGTPRKKVVPRRGGKGERATVGKRGGKVYPPVHFKVNAASAPRCVKKKRKREGLSSIRERKGKRPPSLNEKTNRKGRGPGRGRGWGEEKRGKK